MWTVAKHGESAVTAEMPPGFPAHVPVLLEQVLSTLALHPGAVVLDGTVGAGGHAAALLARVAPAGELHGIDRDPAALELARGALARTGGAFCLYRGSFAEADRLLPPATLERGLDGALLDLGVSSMQLDDPARGFSFRADGPLDMRMDPAQPLAAHDLIAEADEVDLADLIFRYGEERASRRIARAIVRARADAPIDTTARLAEVVRRALGFGASRPHGVRMDPATRTFQALRIATNGELDALELAIPRLAALLAPGGALAIISFHSLEDRRVKQAFRALAATGDYVLVTKRPIVPDATEAAANRRSRSAKLRVLARAGVR